MVIDLFSEGARFEVLESLAVISEVFFIFLCVISGFRCGVNDIFALLECYTA